VRLTVVVALLHPTDELLGALKQTVAVLERFAELAVNLFQTFGIVGLPWHCARLPRVSDGPAAGATTCSPGPRNLFTNLAALLGRSGRDLHRNSVGSGAVVE
jgi:hypothetical protein